MRILGIDYGSKKTGIATTDYSQSVISPLINIQATNDINLINILKQKLAAYLDETETIVVGYPTLLNGNKNNTTLKVEAFFELMKSEFPNKNIILISEQFTTYVAVEQLYEAGLEHKSVARSKDKVSACLIIETYLNKK